MAKDVKFNINLRVNGQDMLVSASANSKTLAKNLGIVKDQTDRFRNAMLNLNQSTQALQNFASGISQMSNVLQTYLNSSNTQIEAETKLANNMRNTMDAREEDIQSIKDLCAAQQQLGVIGDEVQLAGAQELATYLEQKSSLEKLIPVMNDMLAQQYGLNASQESAAQIATMLGKVMEGQTGALSRYGYKFDEAQEYILKYGDEEERAATLADVVSQSVGGMNETLAQTDAGKAKQLANELGDLNERVGSMLSPFSELIQSAGQLGLALNAIITVGGGVVGALKMMTTFLSKTWSVLASTSAGFNLLVAEEKLLIKWTTATGMSFKALQVIFRSFMGLGIGLVIWGITEAISALISKASDAEDGFESLKESEDRYTSAAAEAKVEIDKEIKSLGSLIEAKKDTSKAVARLNEKYGESFGVYKTAAEWYDTLVNKSKIYIRQKGFEAQALTLSMKLAEAEVKLDENFRKRRELWKSGKAQEQVDTSFYDVDGSYRKGPVVSVDSEEYRGLKEEAKPLIRELTTLRNQLNTAQGKIDEYGKALSTTAGKTKELTVETMTLGQVKARLDALDKESLTASTKTEFDRIIKERKELENRKKALEKAMGIGAKSTTSKKEPAYYNNPSNEKEYRKNLNYYSGKLTGEDNEEQSAIRKEITLLQQKLSLIDLEKKKMAVPAELKSLDDVAKKMDYLNAKRKLASDNEIADIDKEIAATERKQKSIEMASSIQIDDDKISTYSELNRKREYYNYLVNEGAEDEIKAGRAGLDALDKVQKKLDEIGKINPPTENLKTLEEYDKAIQFYTEQQQKADANEVQKLQQKIDGLTKGSRALRLGMELPSMQKEFDEIRNLSGKEYRIKIKGIGFEGLTDKIKELSKELDNPHLTETQREQLLSLRKGYEDMRKDAALSFSTLTSGWDSIKGIGNSIENMNNALEGNANAWQLMTSIVDGFLSLYQGIAEIVSIIDMITKATMVSTVAKTEEAVATTAAATAESADMGVQEVAAAAKAPVIAANKAATASYLELAASEYMAAHAYIPFAGFGIGAGFTSAAAALVKSMGVMAFANGGVISGPTIGLMGEYAGASTNPEVVAPLDKLRSMIQPQQVMLPPGSVIGKVKGTDILLVSSTTSRIRSKSGHRTVIK